MPLSIRYDLSFQEQLVLFTNDQLILSYTADGNAPTPQQEQDASQSYQVLCDLIDSFCTRQVDAAKNPPTKE